MKKIVFLLCGVVALATQTSSIQASAFYNRLYTDANRAFAGDVAAGRDASTVYANPAGMVLLEKFEVKGGGGFVFNDTRFNTQSFLPPQGIFQNGISTDRPLGTTFVPNLYAVYPFDHMAVGLGITTPYSIDTQYDDWWVGRFNTIKTKIETIDIAPTVAFDITDWLSFGVGVDIQYVDLNLTQAKTSSNELIATLSGAPITIPFLLSLGIPIPEFRTEITGHNWSFGVNTGIIAKVNETLRFGFDFRSATTSSLDGDLTTKTFPTGSPFVDPGTAALATVLNLPIQTNLKLPSILTFGGSWDITPRWNLGVQGQWFNWERFNEIKSISKNAFQLPSTAGGITTPNGVILPAGTQVNLVPEHFKNTFSVAAGTEYYLFDDLAVQLGFLYDEKTTEGALSSLAFPSGNQYWLTTGLSYQFAPGILGNVGYAHIFLDDTQVNLVSNGALLLGTNNSVLIGSFDSSINIISASLGIRF